MRTFRHLVATAVIAVLFVGLLEVGMRLAGVRYEYSFYASDPEGSVAPAPGTVRIALLGDSLVAATQVPLEKTMAQVLERTLNHTLGQGGHSFEVLNFAQGGSRLAQQYLMLRNRVGDFQPQIVMMFVSPISVPTCSRKL